MLQELRLATFNVCNLALPGVKYYDDQEPYTVAEYEAKTTWIAQQIDQLDADVIGFQEIFSQAALKYVLSKSQKYQQAHHIGFDTEPHLGPIPSVALVTRLPLLSTEIYARLPHDLTITLPGVIEPLTSFTRPILSVQLQLTPERTLHVFVCHLKSKRPDYRIGNGDHDQLGIAILRSLIRRSTDALGLRAIATDCMLQHRMPVVVLGDFNDIAGAVSTQIVMGSGQPGKIGPDDRLFESYRIQSGRDPHRDVGYTHVHEGNYETVDHILVSGEFNSTSDSAIGEVSEVIYLNDHIALKRADASDHGQVMVRIRLFDADCSL